MFFLSFISLLCMCIKQKSDLLKKNILIILVDSYVNLSKFLFATRIRIHVSWIGPGFRSSQMKSIRNTAKKEQTISKRWADTEIELFKGFQLRETSCNVLRRKICFDYM